MDGSVEALRTFRDDYLGRDPLGKAFVSAYYQASPGVARFIDDNDVLRASMRVGLMPSVAVSQAAMNVDVATKGSIAGVLILGSLAVFLRLRRKSALAGPGFNTDRT
jgi:hypothetical protein